MKKKWVYPDQPDQQLVDNLAAAINVNQYLGQILVQRGISTFDEAKAFFRPSLKKLHDPFLMADMAKAVDRLNNALFNKEKVLIYGDYDVDGTTAVSLMYRFLKDHNHESVSYYVPDRYDEGYGISEIGIKWAHENNFTLVIALDCGIKAFKNATLAKDLGIDLIICDHHLPGDELPDAFAILDPKREDCTYPFDGLCGCGVGFKFLQAFCEQNTIDQNELYAYLDLVAVSIASDLVPIVDENRILTYYGLQKLSKSPSQGLNALKGISGLKNDVDIQGIVFGIGPRINAAGRIDHARDAVRLLVANDQEEAKAIAAKVNKNNTVRKDFDKDITLEALISIDESEELKSRKSTVLYNADWHKGVIGIVASRCIEKYYRPTIILTQSNGKATGSARSVEGFDIYEAIASCSELLEQYGGHKFAAGLTMSIDNIEAFQQKFEEEVTKVITEDILTPKINVDCDLPIEKVDFKFFNILNQLGPFGPGNMEPIFSSSELVLVGQPKIMKDVHMKFYVRHKDGKQSYEALAFGMADMKDELIKSESIKLAYHLQKTTYMGNSSLQLMVKDICAER
ncbi:MAG: single-stranded-DNA-specific exonuclease RecJ [Cyclobacteriaceae bacterium]